METTNLRTYIGVKHPVADFLTPRLPDLSNPGPESQFHDIINKLKKNSFDLRGRETGA